jgi:hypothetical protein
VIVSPGGQGRNRKEANMSEKQKALIEKIAQLPDTLQDKFIDRVDGAIFALDFVESQNTAKEAKDNGDSSG